MARAEDAPGGRRLSHRRQRPGAAAGRASASGSWRRRASPAAGSRSPRASAGTSAAAAGARRVMPAEADERPSMASARRCSDDRVPLRLVRSLLPRRGAALVAVWADGSPSSRSGCCVAIIRSIFWVFAGAGDDPAEHELRVWLTTTVRWEGGREHHESRSGGQPKSRSTADVLTTPRDPVGSARPSRAAEGTGPVKPQQPTKTSGSRHGATAGIDGGEAVTFSDPYRTIIVEPVVEPVKSPRRKKVTPQRPPVKRPAKVPAPTKTAGASR